MMQPSLILALIALLFVALALAIARFATISYKKLKPQYKLDRHHANPILSPQLVREWEHGGTFNPAAIKDDRGIVHLLYRAIGADGISRVGHSSSENGKDFNVRSSYPVFEPLPGYGMPDAEKVTGPKKYCPAFYTSGGGWGGSEDPRAVTIDGRVYMTYVAFEGWSSVRIGLTSILLEDLKKGKWNWRRPCLISPPRQVNKNWLIFPEKIHGKFAILHGITPNILVDYVDSLDALGDTKFIKSSAPRGGRKGFWDNWVRGAGPPPIKTELGWLLLYHAMDRADPNKYKVGAMILDLNDPTKVLYRSPHSILEPDAHYENDGKPGVVYASGAVVIGENLMIYYGGGDKHVCIAETPMKKLLEWLVSYGRVS
ncbi:MAG: hypothetical protein WCS89_00880 [Candidatus Paceibacterota bacterium]